MNDLISRQAAIDAHCELCVDRDTCNCDICPDVEVFQLLPSAQPERKKGKWIKGGEQPYFRKHFDIVVCSKCNKRGEHRWNFCPNCGADMRGEQGE